MEEAVKELISIFEQIYEVKYTGKQVKHVPGNSTRKCLSPKSLWIDPLVFSIRGEAA